MAKSITDLSSVTTIGLDLAKQVFQESWPGGFRQRDKWCFCLKAA